MNPILALLTKTLLQVWVTFTHNWPFLIVSILIGVVLKLYLDQNKVGAFLLRHQQAGVVTATAAAVTTPLCSCGTTAVILGMLAGSMPWAPIIAFMVASPLTSPEELVYSAGLFGWPFAIAFFAASIVLGLLGGWVAGLLEKRGWFRNQARYTSPAAVPACACESNLRTVSAPVPALATAAQVAMPRTLSNLRRPTRVMAASSACCAPAPTLKLAAEPCGCQATAVPMPAPACACEAVSAAISMPASACACGTPLAANRISEIGPLTTARPRLPRASPPTSFWAKFSAWANSCCRCSSGLPSSVTF
jgi:hypothetical protein